MRRVPFRCRMRLKILKISLHFLLFAVLAFVLHLAPLHLLLLADGGGARRPEHRRWVVRVGNDLDAGLPGLQPCCHRGIHLPAKRTPLRWDAERTGTGKLEAHLVVVPVVFQGEPLRDDRLRNACLLAHRHL